MTPGSRRETCGGLPKTTGAVACNRRRAVFNGVHAAKKAKCFQTVGSGLARSTDHSRRETRTAMSAHPARASPRQLFFQCGETAQEVCVVTELVPIAAVLAKKEFQMNRGIRGFMLIAGSAALLSSQAVYAAQTPSFSAIDPLVSLSVLGSQESNAAVCGAAAGATAGAAAAAAATEASQGAAGCVLPVNAPPAAAPVGAMAPVAAAGPGIGMLPLLLGLAAIVGVAALVLSNGGHGKGDLTPVSPA